MTREAITRRARESVEPASLVRQELLPRTSGPKRERYASGAALELLHPSASAVALLSQVPRIMRSADGSHRPSASLSGGDHSDDAESTPRGGDPCRLGTRLARGPCFGTR